MGVLETGPTTLSRDSKLQARQFLWKFIEHTPELLTHAQLRARVAAFLNLYIPFEASTGGGIQDV